MRTALVLLALLGLSGCASSMDNKAPPPTVAVTAPTILPQHRIADGPGTPHLSDDVPLKTATPSQNAARMN
jgi:uncharacterized protein YceK